MARIILVGGGSASGKTYVTNLVMKEIGEENVTRISLDDYYKDLTNIPFEERTKINYDHPKAFDWKLIRQQIQDIKEDKIIEKPVYDFTIHNRSDKIEKVTSKKLVIVEGIMALIDKDLRDLSDLKIFIDASSERRFLRRILRDTNERGRTISSVVNQYFTTVQPMYDEIIKPSSQYADLIINNDGQKNLAVDALAALLKAELDIAPNPNKAHHKQENEFSEERLTKAFGK